MLNPEFYLGAFQDGQGQWHTTRFGGQCRTEETRNEKLWERRPVYLVPVPGETSWYTELRQGPDDDVMAPCTPSYGKRTITLRGLQLLFM